jgi:dihydrodipicolinate synthase/N-acetylneuraminate lyase
MAGKAHFNDILPAGVYAAALTPQRDHAQRIDGGAALEGIDFLSSSAVDGILLLGATGNFVHFDVEERERFTAFALKRSRKPAAVNVSHSTLEVTAYLAEHAADCGARTIFAMPPYFYRYSGERVEAYFRALRAAVERRIPLFLYNVPHFASAIPRDAAARLLGEGLYAGILDASGEERYLEGMEGMRLLGNDARWRAERRKAHGFVSICAAAAPELVSALERAAWEENGERAAKLAERLDQLMEWLDRFPVPFGLMEAARLRGLPMRPDAGWLAGAPLEEFREWFLAWTPEMVRDAKG